MNYKGRSFNSWTDMFNYAYSIGDMASIEKWASDWGYMSEVKNVYNSIKEQEKQKAEQAAEQESQQGLEESLGIKDAESKEIGKRKAIVFQDLMGEVPEELSKNPAVQQRVADLSVKMTGDDVPTGPDATRSMLANRARQGILGAASAGGDSSATVGQQSSMRAEANKAIGMKSLAGTESAIQERDAARSALASLKSEVLDSDIKAKEQYKKRQARTAIGLEGIKETARQAAMKGVVINRPT